LGLKESIFGLKADVLLALFIEGCKELYVICTDVTNEAINILVPSLNIKTVEAAVPEEFLEHGANKRC
jgi:phosphomannomutase